MGNLAITYQFIADILSFETPNHKLEKDLSHAAFDWDAIVIEGSKHLVLPAIYCKLKTKQLLHLLPEELKTYLEEITAINRNRNKSIIAQVHSISQILNAHKIEHTFLKGSALLILGCYEDNAERMVGDIDILVNPSQVHDAFNILKTKGYNKTFGYAYEKKDFRHLDRLISEGELAAIELHSHLLDKKHKSLIDLKSLLNTKTIVNSVPIPHIYFLRMNLILGWQINDKGHYYNSVSLKSLYDSIVIDTHKDNPFILDVLKLKLGQSYLELAKTYFNEFSEVPSNNYMIYISFSHNVIMTYKPIRIIVKSIKHSVDFIVTRLLLLFTNCSYLKHFLRKKLKVN